MNRKRNPAVPMWFKQGKNFFHHSRSNAKAPVFFIKRNRQRGRFIIYMPVIVQNTNPDSSDNLTINFTTNPKSSFNSPKILHINYQFRRCDNVFWRGFDTLWNKNCFILENDSATDIPVFIFPVSYISWMTSQFCVCLYSSII